MNHYILMFEMDEEDLRTLDEYVRIKEIRKENGAFISRNQACYSIVKEFVDSIAPLIKVKEVPKEA